MKNYLIIWDNGAETVYFRCAAPDADDALTQFNVMFPGGNHMYDEIYQEVELA